MYLSYRETIECSAGCWQTNPYDILPQEHFGDIQCCWAKQHSKSFAQLYDTPNLKTAQSFDTELVYI